jgi:hypothetical protein
MKRLLTTALLLGVTSGFGLALSGCSEESKVQESSKVSTPEGTTTTTTEVKTDSSGSNPPAPAPTPEAPK